MFSDADQMVMSLHTSRALETNPISWENKLQITEEKENVLTIFKVALELV